MSRNAILTRIREALKIAAPLPVAHEQHHDHGQAHDAPRQVILGSQLAERRAWLPPVPDTFEGQFALFAKNCTELKTELVRIPSVKLADTLADLAVTERWTRIATHRSELTSKAVALPLAQPALITDAGYDAGEMERCDAGITECDCLVAQTGTIVLTARTAGGRALSVLPPHHVVIARSSQLLPDLTAAFEFLQQRHGPDYPSFMTLITGPSRTGDIERILVLGAHGPKRLTIVFLD